MPVLFAQQQSSISYRIDGLLLTPADGARVLDEIEEAYCEEMQCQFSATKMV